MKDTELYTALLGLQYPWRVREVKLNMVINRIEVWVEEAPGAQWTCAACGKPVSIYDHSEERTWRHLDTCQCETHIHVRLPRTKCPEHGVKQVVAPWAEPGSRFTLLFEGLLIDVLKECDITGATRLTGSSWDEIFKIMEKAVKRGLARKEKRIPEYLSIDEKAFAKRHRYETLVCDLQAGTVEYVIEDRGQESLEKYYRQFTEKERKEVKAVAMDMWDPYIAATRAYIPEAEDKIIFDRFHVTKQVTEAVDKVRRKEHKDLQAEGDERLKGTRYLWLTNQENIPEWRKDEFSKVKDTNLRTSRAWAIKESLRKFWEYRYTKNARSYFQRWYFWATHSKIEPIIRAAKTIKRHLANIMTYFKHRITNATAEGLNSKIQMVKMMACGYRNRDHYRTAIYFHCGGLDLYPRLTS